MISALLIDDELNNLANLQALLGLHCPAVAVVATATTVDSALEIIAEIHPDLLFLDIQMPGKNGFDLLAELPFDDIDVIFVTAFDQYGIQAVKFSALDYLLKPVRIPELKTAVEKAAKRILDKKKNVQLENLVEMMGKQGNADDKRIALPSQKEIRLIPVKEIIRCESSNNYTTFYLTSGEILLVSKAIYEYEELLLPFGFIRCHQSHLVNGSLVRALLKEDNGYLIMSNGDKVPLARQRKEQVRKELGI